MTRQTVFITICLFREKHHYITIQLLNCLPDFHTKRHLVLVSDREILESPGLYLSLVCFQVLIVSDATWGDFRSAECKTQFLAPSLHTQNIEFNRNLGEAGMQK